MKKHWLEYLLPILSEIYPELFNVSISDDLDKPSAPPLLIFKSLNI